MDQPRSGSGGSVDGAGSGDVPGGNAAAAAVQGHPPSPSPASATDTPAVGATHRRAASATDASRPWEDAQRTEMLERLKREFFMPPVVENPYTVNHVVGEVRGGRSRVGADGRTTCAEGGALCVRSVVMKGAM